MPKYSYSSILSVHYFFSRTNGVYKVRLGISRIQEEFSVQFMVNLNYKYTSYVNLQLNMLGTDLVPILNYRVSNTGTLYI